MSDITATGGAIDPGPPRKLAFLEKVAVFLIGLLFVALLVQVLLRPFAVSFVWIGELSIPLFIWIVFIGAAIASRRGEHPYVEIGYLAVSRRLSPDGRRSLDAMLAFAALVFYAVVIAGLVGMTVQTWDHVPGLLPGYRVGYLYLGALVGVTGCMVATFGRLVAQWRRGADPGPPDPHGDSASII
ncbi:MAG: TRAP transporter small permease [Casimicrobiaceae bacterium]